MFDIGKSLFLEETSGLSIVFTLAGGTATFDIKLLQTRLDEVLKNHNPFYFHIITYTYHILQEFQHISIN